jgi:hypothetical protein
LVAEKILGKKERFFFSFLFNGICLAAEGKRGNGKGNRQMKSENFMCALEIWLEELNKS